MRQALKFKNLFNSFSKNIFNKQSYKKFSKADLLKHSVLIMGFQLNSYLFYNKLYCDDGSKEVQKQDKNQNQQEKLSALRNLIKYDVCQSSDIKEGQIFPFEIEDSNGEKYPILLVRHKGKVFAVGGVCTYDGKTQLKDGICFENKLYCPLHGCAYNIHNGQTELAPAMDDLPRFFAEEKNGKVVVYAPKEVPKRLIPHFMPRDYNDLRKVVIIGSGASAQACVETLRHMGYTGEIVMVSKETKFPYDKTKLSKEIRNLDYKKIQLRDQDWFKQYGVSLMMGRECVYVDKTHGSPHIKLEDGLRLEYDALVIATGSLPASTKFKGTKEQKNLLYLEDIEDHKKLREQLETAKNITVMGANVRSLETAATIRKEYPHIKEIYIIDENKENPLKETYGKELADELIKQQVQNDVWFVLHQKIDEMKGNDEKIEKIKFENGLEINTDVVLMFPNNRIGNTEWIDESNMDQFDYDEFGKMKTNYNMRSDYKRIFATGECANTQYFAINDEIGCEGWNMSWHTGMTAAYNILALRVPFHQIPFQWNNIYGKTLQYLGYARYWNEAHIIGSIKDWDFVVVYSFYDSIIAAAGTPSQTKNMNILNEAFRLEILPSFKDLKDGKVNINNLENIIRSQKRSGCFKEGLYNVRYDPYNKDVIWQNRDKTSEYYNFYEQGLTPVENKMDEEQHI
ncbi:Rieske [2Fe-2S] iron-sulfur domain [Pseudocohnilembus persalinus]|uniref:Rieske [2Fe-2S] iron-sulfur domain n=1 Tax=Pseudocohnilembus persalinus TaxID=266149 RepID=A0A0V0R7A7_PSEPJ|nr:Rieske [2Fe-2S] iron-sulfur domain [Pseudocohnilembus persalinus]|eukprot:KRX10397.1 Rieske [2Fe-2S] iron-sulfur domain [Pseudocohnilembus persalinus]